MDNEKTFTLEFDINALEDGHPAQILHLENVALEKFLDELDAAIESNDVDNFIKKFPRLNSIYGHYGKKEMLFMPTLSRYGVTGPSKVMWGVDDEIKKNLHGLQKKISPDNFYSLKEKIIELIKNLREMIFKEENIFIPLSMKVFTQADWLSIYRDAAEFGYAFIDDAPKWASGENFIIQNLNDTEGKVEGGQIKFDTGELNFAQLKGILKLLPVDITFIDKDDNVKFFVNEGGVFNRPKLTLGNPIFDCHPPQVLPVIHKMLDDFKAKKRNSMEVFRPIKGKPVGVTYHAVYDDAGEYIGAVEFVQDFSKAVDKFKD